MSVTIVVRNSGPLRIEGEGLVVVDQQGKAFGLGGRGVVALCRCGHSQNKPFCDGAHARAGFQSECQAFDLPAPAPKA